MIIEKLKFRNFRNLKDNHICPSEKTNIITGCNGQGKTNLLEGLWIFNGVKSFRGSKDRELIAFGKESAELEIEFFSAERHQNARIRIFSGKREIYINEIKRPSSAYLMGKITSIVFSPEHLSLVKAGPGVRRKFIDSAICQVKPKYSVYLAKYNKILTQRNALLKDISNYSDFSDMLDVWDKEIAGNASVIISERLKYISGLSKFAGCYHKGISENKEILEISYKNNYYNADSDIKKISEDFLNTLNNSRKEDIQSGYTNKGPHRDDIDIYINSKSAKQYASQGQQRSAVLSMKLAEATLVDEITGRNPAILLDDVLSELDRERQIFLLNKIKDKQVFITCCDYQNVNSMFSGKIFNVSNGNIS